MPRLVVVLGFFCGNDESLEIPKNADYDRMRRERNVLSIQDIITLFEICQDMEYKREMTIHHWVPLISYQKVIRSFSNMLIKIQPTIFTFTYS